MKADDVRLQWIQRYADGIATAEEVVRLQAALHEDAALRKLFLDYVHLDTALEATAAAHLDAGVATRPMIGHADRRAHRPAWALPWFLRGLGLAMILAVTFAIWSVQQPGARVDAQIVSSENVRWVAADAGSAEAGATLGLRTVELADGWVVLKLVASGVMLKLSGPAQVQFETAMRVRVVHGRLSVDVGPRGVGFTVVTDAGEVVDLGTSFGVEADRGGESRVAVFSGQVKVRSGRGGKDGPFTTLSEGEAVRFSAVAGLRRWEQVAMAAGAAGIHARSTSGILATVRDNLGDEALHPFYGVVTEGMRRESLAFTDKPNPRWAPAVGDVIPPWLEGADLIRTYHQFRHRRDYELALTLREAAVVFVLVDARPPPPTWLAERFQDTGARVTVGPWQIGIKSEPGVEVREDGLPYLSFAVWRAEAPAGEFKLRAPRDSAQNNTALMYGVAVKKAANP